MKKITRDENGLIVGVNYIFDENGMVNWRAMIRSEFLVPNRQYFERFQKPVPKTIEGLEDKELLILLGGIKELANLRGFSSVAHQVTSPSPEYVADVCSIEFIPNFETEGRQIKFSAIGDACPQSTNGFGRMFLGAIAENRAFVRCVRNFLRINIVGQDEISPNKAEEVVSTNIPATILDKLMIEKNISLEAIKTKLAEEGNPDAQKWQSTTDIPKMKIFELIERIKKKN